MNRVNTIFLTAMSVVSSWLVVEGRGGSRPSLPQTYKKIWKHPPNNCNASGKKRHRRASYAPEDVKTPGFLTCNLLSVNIFIFNILKIRTSLSLPYPRESPSNNLSRFFDEINAPHTRQNSPNTKIHHNGRHTGFSLR